MLERIIALTLRHKGVVLHAVAAIMIVGVYSYLTIPIDAFPDVSNTQVEIVSDAPGLSALEIERFVTAPIEMSMRGLPRVVQMRSVTKFGLAVVTIGCHVGLRTTGGTQGVGRSTTNAVVASSVAVLAVDFFVTKLLIVLMY